MAPYFRVFVHLVMAEKYSPHPIVRIPYITESITMNIVK